MARKSNAPAVAATQDDDLPKTAVQARGKDLVIQNLQDQLAGYMDPNEPAPAEPQTNNEEETFKKRYGDLRRHLQQKENQFKQEASDLRTQVQQLTAAANQPMPQNKEEFEAWKAKYPQIASFIEIIADEKASQRASQLQEELSNVKVKLTETEKEKAFATLKVLVPDIEDIVRSQPYKTWVEQQPVFVQEELNTSEDPHRIAYWIGIYRLSITPAKPAKKEDKLAALDSSVKGTGPTPSANSGKWKFTQSQIAKMSPEEYEKMEPEIIEARNSGAIMDDMSKRNTVWDV
jgi:hypothetical protein